VTRRLPYGADDLIAAIRASHPDATVEPGNLDGYQVYRSVTFDQATSTWLAAILDRPLDPRLHAAEYYEGILTLYFVHASSRADQRGPWVLPDLQV
jgi:hypothetical protein